MVEEFLKLGGGMPNNPFVLEFEGGFWLALLAFAAASVVHLKLADARQYTVPLGIAGALAVAGLVAWMVLIDPVEIRKAKQLLASSQYAEAGQVLEPYLKTKPADAKALYLAGMAGINNYATSDRALFAWQREGTPEALQTVKTRLKAALADAAKWRELAGKELEQTLAKVPTNAPDAVIRLLSIQRLREQLGLADPKLLAKELWDKASSLPSVRGGPLLNEEMTDQVLAWDSTRKPEVAKAYLALATQSAETAAVQARDALARAARLDANLAKSEEATLLGIQLAQPEEKKLAMAQAFLESFPASSQRVKLLLAVIEAAPKVVQQQSYWGPDRKTVNIESVVSNAQELLEKYPTTPMADEKVFALAKGLAQQRDDEQGRKSRRQALVLAAALLKASPDTPLKMEVQQAQAQWQERTFGKLAPGQTDLADLVEKELKIMTLSTGGAIRLLASNPRAAHVVDVNCRRQDFTAEEADILRKWVADGGVAWIRSDALLLFGIGHSRGYGNELCGAAVSPQLCPIVTGCQTVRVREPQYAAACDLKHRNVIPLLAANGHTYLSLIPYGKGWISNPGQVDLNEFDGARFWLNFRLFCLGRRDLIPGAPPQTVSIPIAEDSSGSQVPAPGNSAPSPPPKPRVQAPSRPSSYTLTVRATGCPNDANCGILVRVGDQSSTENAQPQFSREWDSKAVIELEAPAEVGGRPFDSWDGPVDDARGRKAWVTNTFTRTIAVCYKGWQGVWKTSKGDTLRLAQTGSRVTSQDEGASANFDGQLSDNRQSLHASLRLSESIVYDLTVTLSEDCKSFSGTRRTRRTVAQPESAPEAFSAERIQ